MEFTYVKSPKPTDKTATPGQSGAPAAATVEEPLTAEQLAANTKDMYKSMGWGEAPAEVLEPTRPASMPAEPAAAAPAAAPAEPAAPPAPEPEPEPEPEPSAAQLISQTARETAREVASALRPPEPAPEPEPEFELSDQDRKDLPVLQYLERTNPKKYGGIVAATMKYFKEHYDYAQAWLEANPEKQYDPDEEEHAAWIAEHQPPNISREELDEARVDMRVEEKFNRDIKPRFDQQEADRAFQASLPTIGQHVDTAVRQMVRQVDPALADLLKDASGNERLTNETIAKIDEKDPIAKEIMDRIVANELEPMILELEKTMIPELNFKFTPDRNPIHRQIADFVAQKEASMAKAPISVQMVDGKRWVSLDEYSRLVKNIQSGRGDNNYKNQAIADLDRTVWCLDSEMIKGLMVDHCAKKAQAAIAKQDALAQKKYGNARNGGQGATAGAAPHTAAAAAAPGGKPKPPSSAGQSVSVTTQNPGAPASKSYGEAATDVMFSR